jgi:hypothetical protein
MIDLSKTITPKSDQLNADDLIAGDRVITIREVRIVRDINQPVAIFYDGDEGKPYKPCKSMRRVLVMLWGPDGQTYIGRSLCLFRDKTVNFGGVEVGGIRISKMSHIPSEQKLSLTVSKSKKSIVTITPLVIKEAVKTDEEIVKDLITRMDAIVEKEALTAALNWSLAKYKDSPEIIREVTAYYKNLMQKFEKMDDEQDIPV